MGAIVLERQQRLDRCYGEERERRRVKRAPRSTEVDVHGGPTLDDLITGVWEGLAVRGAAACPLCGGRMSAQSASPSDSPHEGNCEGRCEDCGTTLA
jgi:hypothetical protein